MKKYLLLSLSFALLSIQASCQSNDKNKKTETRIQNEQTAIEVPIQDGLDRAYFASGCF
ncbi:MAG: peptide-methionine (S)-S-oxide reductase, partial [Flavobacteriaceae bacterium]|nr:peptide-methionine (S)-S-oxide reductase [Flavobacteriaceae bacterium]